MKPSRRQRIDEEQRTSSAKSNNKGAGKGDGSDGYTVVVRGLSTELASIYRDAIPRFLLPRVALQSDFSSATDEQQQKQEKRASSVSSSTVAGGSSNKRSLTTPMMRPLQDVRVAFRVETLSAYVTVPEEEAKKALRTANATAAAASANTDEQKQQQQEQSKKKRKNTVNPNNSLSENLSALCNDKEIFGFKVSTAAAQSNQDQNGLITCSCIASRAVTAGALHSVLKPVFPGFISVLPAHLNQPLKGPSGGSYRSKKHRLVFTDEKAAFEAKKLLDEFPASEDLRLAVVLNDQATRRYQEFVRSADQVNNDE